VLFTLAFYMRLSDGQAGTLCKLSDPQFLSSPSVALFLRILIILLFSPGFRGLPELSCSVLRLVRNFCVFILRLYGLGSLACSDAELT